MPKWTKEQQQAIDSRNGTILVSAAAGSGKTTVLVERVIRRLEDEENPCSADRLLIVTFTKAATAQMKEKIAAALDKRLEENPENEHLIRQRMLLPFANISTIDGFCGKLVRENFQQLGISPDFKLLEQSQLSLMMGEAVDKVIEQAYKENSPEFRKLLDLLVSGSNDGALADMIISLYNSSRAFPYPEKWLDKIVESYENCTSAGESVWGKIIIENIRYMILYCLELSCSAADVISKDDPENAEKYQELFGYYQSFFQEYLNVIDAGNWEDICSYPSAFESGRIPRTKTRYAFRAKAIKAEIVNIVTKRLPKLFCCNEEEFLDDIKYSLPIVKKIVELVKNFKNEFFVLKKMSDGADFSDVVDYTIQLLVEKTDENGNPVKTDLAKEISKSFDEILVDEFQDINETQNLLFKAVSDDEKNLFMVGDVKQSIYRFRQAMPGIFLERREKLEPYEDGNYPAKINLDYNFRSRKGVADFVNYTFSRLMSKTAGELEYDESEQLKAKAEYSPKSCADAELHIITDPVNKVSRTFEAEYIAQYIKNAIDSGLTVKDGDSERKVSYRDFCILLRSPKGKADIYAGVLNEAGVPCHVTTANGFFDATEIKTALAMIRTVDNPQQDIPLVTTMLSPSFGFTPDELASLRIDSRKTSFYTCVKNAANNGNKKCKSFLDCLDILRTLSATLGAGDFVRELFEVTGYDALVCAMPGGSQRRANLSLLLDYAEKYEQAGHIGISGFIRFVDRVEKRQGDMEIANEISESADVVRIMSIHKSKGLEFPVCILADCSTKFNDDFLRSGIIFNPQHGIAFRRVESYRKFDTLAFKAIQLEEQRATRSEELRVLYVALTRAKERLVCVLREDNPDKKLSAVASLITGNKINPFRVISSGNMGDWLILAASDHPDFSAKREEPMPFIDFNSELKLKVELFEDFPKNEAEAEEIKYPEPDEELMKLLEDRLNFTYPYGNLSEIVAKVSPSQLEAQQESMRYFASSKPNFALDSGVSSASKGTAVHKFMEFYDYTADLDVKEQAKLMVKNKKLSPEEEGVLDYDSLSRFFDSETAKEIAASEILVREKKVTFTVNAAEIYPEIESESANEPIVVQGYIDCAFIRNGKWVIVDYKTDRVNDVNILKDRYSAQLRMYERALKECTGIDVESTIIYSLHLGKTVNL